MSGRTPLNTAHFRALWFRKLTDGVKYREVHLAHLMVCYYDMEPDTAIEGTTGEDRIVYVTEGDLIGQVHGNPFAVAAGEVILVAKGENYAFQATSRARLIESRGAVDLQKIIPVD